MTSFPSIFNDVIGPVMRGPSSSHTAASWRVAKMAVQILNDQLKNAKIEFDKDGAWVTNYKEQGTVLGMNGGLLEIDMTDDAIKNTPFIAKERAISITYSISSFENNHPNSMQLTLSGTGGKKVKVLAASLGGGSFEIQMVNGFNVEMKGDYYTLLIWTSKEITKSLEKVKPKDVRMILVESKGDFLYILESSKLFDEELIISIPAISEVTKIANVDPIMPIISGKATALPFSDIDSLLTYSFENNLNLGKLGVLYEMHRSGLSEEVLLTKMEGLIYIIEESLSIGLSGTNYKDRILHQQSDLIQKAEKSGKILKDSIVNKIIENVAAIMESKSGMEVIVANPTAGSCGTVGGVLSAVSHDQGTSKQTKILAYFAAGIVGAYFAMGPGFSAEEHGCQVECGAAAGMAAAGIVQLFGGTTEQALGAASMAIQNMIGLVCDPIADRVEAPCLGKNTSAAVNALASATMAVSGFKHLIPLDQVIDTVENVSQKMPTCVKCTGLGGLAVTKAAMALKDKLSRN